MCGKISIDEISAVSVPEAPPTELYECWLQLNIQSNEC